MPLCICLSACLPVCLHIRPNSCPYNYIIAIWLCMYISQLLQYLMQKCLCVDNVAYLSVCIPLCISVWLSICLSTFPSVCRFPYVDPTICLPVCLSIYLPARLYVNQLSIYPSICLCARLTVRPRLVSAWSDVAAAAYSSWAPLSLSWEKKFPFQMHFGH